MRLTKEAPCETCPWRAWSNPIVLDVLNAAKWFESGQVQLRLGKDPPHYLLEGIDVYESACARVRADKWERERQKSEQERKANSAKR